MSAKIEQRPDGKLHIEYETGEVFDGDPLEVTQKISEAHQNTKRWAQDIKQKYETLQQASPPQNGGGPTSQNTHTAPADPNEAQLQSYLLTQTAKALGYDNADEFRTDLQRVKGTTDEVQNQLVASQFLAAAPDFPNTPEAIAALSQKVEDMGWGFDTQSMIAAHALLVREHSGDAKKGYAPLTQEQINSTWEQGLRESNRPKAPPMISSQSPDGSQQGYNPWDTKAVPLDKLRADAIRQELEKRQ